jgi:hypothetical protein
MIRPIGESSPVTIGLVVLVLGVQGWVLKEMYATREALRTEFVGRDLFAARMDDMQHQLETMNTRLFRLEQK